MNAMTFVSLLGSMNCGINARKNNATLGFSTFVKTPSRNAANAERGPPRLVAGSSELAVTSMRTPMYTRYTAPTSFTTMNADADVARIADNPIAAIVVWIREPTVMPRAEATPARMLRDAPPENKERILPRSEIEEYSRRNEQPIIVDAQHRSLSRSPSKNS